MTIQAIAGVSATKEAVVMTEYPSIAAGGVGQFLGSLYECVPIRILGIGPKLSHVFALATAPLGVALYGLQKLFGNRYVLTNRNVQIWASRGNRLISQVGLTEVSGVELIQGKGQVFFKSADIRFAGSNGETLLRLAGVKDAGAFMSTIERAMEARNQVEAAQATIEARS